MPNAAGLSPSFASTRRATAPPAPPILAAAAVAPVGDSLMLAAGYDPAGLSAVEATLADGRTVNLPVQVAIQQGLIAIAADGRARATLAGRSASVRPAAQAPRTATLGQEAEGKPDGPKPASAQLATIGRVGMTATGALKIASASGMPSALNLYFFANNVDKYMGGKLLPEWVRKGPIRDFIDFGIVGKMWLDSWRELPGAIKHMSGAMTGARHAATGAAMLSPVKAFFSEMPAEAAKEAAKAAPNIPALSKLFPLIKPLTLFSFSLVAGSSILELPEFLKKHGAGGLLSTKTGRGALLGAVDGTMMLLNTWLPSSPASIWAGFASNTMWMLGLLNGKGVFDTVFGGDPPGMTEGDTPAEGAATGADAAPAGSVPGTGTPLASGPPAAGAQTAGKRPAPALPGSPASTDQLMAAAIADTAAAAREVSRNAPARRGPRRRSPNRR